MLRSHRSRWSGWFKKKSHNTRAERRLSFDSLEERRLLTAGSLDPTFGTGGEVSTTFPYSQTSSDAGQLVVVQPDGEYIVGGSTSSGVSGLGTSSDFLLTRYNADGTLDTSFGNDGQAIANFGLSSTNPTPIITALTLTSSGQIVAVGYVSPLSQDVLVARFNSNGSLDTSFNGTGMVLTPTRETTGVGGVAVQPDGRIVVGATLSGGVDSASGDFAVLRYNTDGSLDTSFGSGGIVTASLSGEPSGESTLALQSDGKIVVGGSEGITDGPGMLQSAATSSPQEFALVRFNANGTVDQTFGNGGEVATAIDAGAEINALAIQPDGKIVAGGSAMTTSPLSSPSAITYDDFALARYNTDGTLDTSFGNDGVVTTDFNSNNDKLTGLAIQANGQIVVAGTSSVYGDDWAVTPLNPVVQTQVPSGTVSTFALARYNANGSLDTSFGTGGKITTDAGSGDSSANAVALQADGDILAVGTDGILRSATSLAMIEYTNSGSLDSAFANNGIDLLHQSNTLVSNGPASAEQTIVQPDGKILVLGFAQTVAGQNTAALARYNSDGSLDASFGNGGSETLNLTEFGGYTNSMALTASGQIVLAGDAYTASGDLQFMVARLNANGSLDTTFGNQGVQLLSIGGGGDETSGLAVQPDGKIVIVGSTSSVRVTADASLQVTPAAGIADSAGGGLLSEDLIRFNADGSLDTSFAGGGVESIPDASLFVRGGAVQLQSDGKIVVADSELLRFNSDGSIDTTFGNDGSVTLPITTGAALVNVSQLIIQPDGEVLVGVGYYAQSSENLELLRYNPDGSIDASFNGGSPVVAPFGEGLDTGFSAVALGNDGQIVVSGNMTNSQYQTTATIFQYNSDGTLDTTFGNQGMTQLATAVNEIALDGSGDIIAVGGQSIDFEVFRFEDSPPNSPDTPITLPIVPPIDSPLVSPVQTIGTITPPQSGGPPLQIPQPIRLPIVVVNPGPVGPRVVQPINSPPQQSPATAPTTLTLTTTGNDQLILQFTDASDFTVSLDGQTTTYNTSQYNAINFIGTTGSSAIVSGALGSAGVAFTTNSAVITGATFTININSTSTIYVYGNSAETAQLNGGSGGNTLVVSPGYSEMYGAGFADFAAGFGQTYGYSSGSQDTAYFYAGAGDTLVSSPTYSYLSAGGAFSAADDFASILAAAAADGSGQAWLYGSTTGTNSFVANHQYSYMSGAGYFNEVTGFNSVMGVSGNSGDYAYLDDTAGGTSFSGYSTYSFLAGANFNYQAMGFANVVATGTTSDQAAVYDSNVGDTIQQSPDGSQVTLNRSNGTTTLNLFGEVAGHVATADNPNYEVDLYYNGLGA